MTRVLPPASVRICLLAAFVLLPLASARAATIVTDGGFESAGSTNTYYAGQFIDGSSWRVTVGAVYIDSADPYVYDGNNALNLTAANPYTADTVAQTIATVSGQRYLVNFYANSDSANTFAFTENGLAVTGSPATIAQNGFPGAVTNSALFTNYFASFTANSASTVLNLTGVASPAIGSTQSGSIVIDEFNIQAAPTPEPGTIVLTLTGLLGLGQTLRRKRA